MKTELYDHIRHELLDYVVKKYAKQYPGEITFETPLLKTGIIDSLSMMTFILFLEQRYDLDFFTVDITREDFTNINILADLIVNNVSLEQINNTRSGD